MTLTDAWKELGVDPGADAEAVRRAYLRLIKTRKPESDPAGFQRAREAYEIARAGGEIESLAAGGPRRHVEVFATAEVRRGTFYTAEGPDAPPGEAADTPSDEPASAEADPGGERPQADIIFDGFSSAWNSVPPSADQRQRLEIAREAVAVLPDDPRAHWLLVTTLSRLGPDTALADALRAGWKAGWPEFLEALLVRLPRLATRDEIEAGFSLREPSARLAAAAAIVAWNAPRAAGLIVELCRSAMDAPLDDRGDHVRDLPIARMLDVILALHAAGALDPAKDAQDTLRSCLQESGLELALVRGPLGGIWTLTEEIGGLPREFPQQLRASFAIATRSGDLNSAYADASYLVTRDRVLVRGWASRLVASAPNVAGILRTALSQEAATAVQRTGSTVSRFVYLLVPIALALVRMCASGSHHSYSPPLASDLPRYSVPSRPIEFPQSGFKPSSPMDIVPLGSMSEALCGPNGPRHGQLVCADVEALLAAVVEHDCNEIPGRLAQVRKVLHAEPPGPEARFLNQAVITRWQLCGGMKQVETETNDP